MRVFRELHYEVRCDRCRLPFRADKGGVCSACGRALCNAHLHGSFLRRLASDSGLSGPPVCTLCRAGVPPPDDLE